ncbi:protein FAM240C-like [Corythoichthys intestinalis]|uniref:protein FAM240C-like n=1 Tax=Corythoichthys intestinalis TaxID=161448 RepID=UPI0025A51498|nr:protein FAM240C-like [Corythoichthys intestinalis]
MVMNVARIHDKQKLKFFWEQRINKHSQQMVEEESRRKSSALTRLRGQWLVKLDQRNEHQQSFFEERLRRSQKAQQRLTQLDFRPS